MWPRTRAHLITETHRRWMTLGSGLACGVTLSFFLGFARLVQAAPSADNSTAALASKVQTLIDINDINDLITRFGHDLDTRDIPDLPSIVLPDAIPGMSAALRDMQGKWQFTQHIITDRAIEVHSDNTATVRANLFGANIGPRPSDATGSEYDAAGRSHFEVRGRYVWSLVRTKIGWRIAKTDLTYLWSVGAIPAAR